MEPAVEVMYSEDGRRGHKSRNASIQRGKEMGSSDSTLKHSGGMQNDIQFNF